MSERDEIEMIKKRLSDLIHEVEEVSITLQKTKYLVEQSIEELKKELEKEIRGEWSWKKKDDKGE